jgi:RHS repeat-associated protein
MQQMPIKYTVSELSKEFTKFAENYFNDYAKMTDCENNDIELPAEIRNLPDLCQEYETAMKAGGQDKLYYFNANHLGSGSLITDGSGQTYQTLAYAPYGEDLVNIRSRNDYDEPYKFTGYERDAETDMDYAHDRNYIPKISIFDRVDRRFDLYPHQSNYAYCSNNPVNRIDPDGMDDYEVSHNGRTIKVADNENKDIVYSLNKNGDRVRSREYDFGTIQNLSSAKEVSDNYYIMKVKGDDQAKDLFEFLATPENFGLKAGQNVEWSRTLTGEAGENGLNFLTTSQGLDNEKAGSYLFDNQLKYGYTIRGQDHNHPTNNPHPSGTAANNGDIPVMKKWKNEGNVIPNAQFRIFTPGLSKKYNAYTESYSIPLPEFVITAKKRK